MPSPLYTWTHGAIEAECAQAYAEYRQELDRRSQTYFAEHPELAGEHRLKARDLTAALPDGFDWLGQYLPERVRHRHHLSGRSSQTVALGLLGAGWRTDQSLEWLFSALSLPSTPLTGPVPEARFEYEVDASLLNEKPYVTTIDFFAETPKLVLCLEAKWGEAGLGRCSCPRGAPATAACSSKVLGREAYWRAAEDLLGLPPREDGAQCPISTSYQAVRNVAAAVALATPDRQAVFALLYDERNPYFRPTGRWPGWPAALLEALRPSEERITFSPLAWQELVQSLPRDPNVSAWAREKHELQVPDEG